MEFWTASWWGGVSIAVGACSWTGTSEDNGHILARSRKLPGKREANVQFEADGGGVLKRFLDPVHYKKLHGFQNC